MPLNVEEIAVCVACENSVSESTVDTTNHNVSNGDTIRRMLVLPCLHIICTDCLESVQKGKLENSPGIFPCPECGYIIQGLHSAAFKTLPDIFMNSVINNNNHGAIEGRTFCTTCDILVTPEEVDFNHREHEIVPLKQMLKGKKEYIATLLNSVNAKISHSESIQKQTLIAKDHLRKTRKELTAEIAERSRKLIEMIRSREKELLAELDAVCEERLEWFAEETNSQNRNLKIFQNSREFADKIIREGSGDDLLEFHNEISARLLHLIHRVKDASLDLLSMKMDLPDPGKEVSHLEKLFGTLTQGRISCGDAQMLQKFNVGLKWPTSLVATKTRDIVIAGKEGTFDSRGSLLFYDRHAKLLRTHEYEESKCIPYDVTCALDGTIYASDNKGSLTKFSADKTSVMANMFKGTSGRLALTTANHLLVTSSEEKCIWEYDSLGSKIRRLPPSGHLPSVANPHCLATNSNNDIIISELQGHKVSVYNSEGIIKFCYTGGSTASEELKCPSSVCCDPFNNILIADFTNDSIHLVSQSGQFLGHLLTKDNSISCPNFVSLDHEGHLFIGQYGGDISVYRYLSCVKHA
ncbi:hypothetical protein CAPTEDRAFT_198459 [Capitella teleta]|uniref:RING-type domain-containing protein n=1 Tax=Capitella teleta TaxID=283909 RepID=R7TEQ0_CAPTE|nr:hypothetical protein CAPTEDRAFT_198459 [Capitella teleta]|eukprot:ELT89541.1 hypothetical protein CAPTEDRAFT_198459 [Capitella teleta]